MRTETESTDDMTLLFVFRDDGEEVLLIRKKRKIGAGLYNGPGGFVEADDSSIKEAAIRETKEEVEITPKDVTKLGELDFVYRTPKRRCHVYRADRFSGTPTETDEADPEWFSTTNIPYDEMMEGDMYWFPNVIRNNVFRGVFYFDPSTDTLTNWELVAETSFRSE